MVAGGTILSVLRVVDRSSAGFASHSGHYKRAMQNNAKAAMAANRMVTTDTRRQMRMMNAEFIRNDKKLSSIALQRAAYSRAGVRSAYQAQKGAPGAMGWNAFQAKMAKEQVVLEAEQNRLLARQAIIEKDITANDALQTKFAKEKLLIEQKATANAKVYAALSLGGKTIGTGIRTATTGLAIMSMAFAGLTASVVSFDKQMYNTAAIARMSTVEMDSLAVSVIQLSKVYPKSATELAAATYNFVSAGLRGKEVLDAMNAALPLAVANNVDLTKAGLRVIQVLKAFNMEMDSTAEIADKMQFIVSNSLATFDRLMEAYKFAAPGAAAVGVSFEELSAMIGVLENKALEAGIAGRNLRQEFMKLIQPENAAKLQRLADSMGLSVEVMKDGRLNMSGIIEAFGSTTMNAEELGKSIKIFGIRGVTAFLALTQASDNYAELLEGIYESQGLAIETAEQQMLSFANQMSLTKNLMLAPIMEDRTFLDRLSVALGRMQEYFGSAEWERTIQSFMLNMAVFVEKLLPELIKFLGDIMGSGVLNYFILYGEALSNILGIFNKLDPWMQKTIVHLLLLNKILPITTLYNIYAAESFTAMAISAGSAAGALGLLFGLMLLFSADSRRDVFVGGLIAIAGALFLIATAAVAARTALGDVSAAPFVAAAILSIVGVSGLAAYKLNSLGAPSASGSYASGVEYVPRTDVYRLHKGEVVVPADESRRSGTTIVFEGDVFGYDDFDEKVKIAMETNLGG